LAASNGFVGGYKTAAIRCPARAGGEGTGMERDYEWSSAVYLDDLMAATKVGRNAGRNAVRRLNPRGAQNARVPWFTTAASLAACSVIWPAPSTAAPWRAAPRSSGQDGRADLRSSIRIIDNPHRQRGQGSRPFDAEGLATKRYVVIDKGVLTTWFLDLAAARQLDLKPTGHATRGTSGPPSPTTSNFYWRRARSRSRS